MKVTTNFTFFKNVDQNHVQNKMVFFELKNIILFIFHMYTNTMN